jgi:glutamine synthetase
LLSRQEVCYSEYAKNIKIESLAMLDIVKREIIVAATKFENELLNIIQAKRAIEVNALTEINLLKRVSQLNADADRLQKELVVELQQIRTINSIAIRAHKYHDNILNIMNQLRSACDELERIIPKHL